MPWIPSSSPRHSIVPCFPANLYRQPPQVRLTSRRQKAPLIPAGMTSCESTTRAGSIALSPQAACGQYADTTVIVHAALPKLAFANPTLANQWHPTENNGLTPADVSTGSSRSVTWLCTECPCGHPHIWQAAVGVRARRIQSGCPFCAGKRPCVCKSLARLRPDIAGQWDFPNNAPLRPEDVTEHSNKRVTWFCASHPEPHTWTATVYSRTKERHASGCPACSDSQKNTKQSESAVRTCPSTQMHASHIPHCDEAVPVQSFPCWLVGAPELARQWHPTKNGDLTPDDISCGASHKAWWQCQGLGPCRHQHEWQAKVSDRYKRNSQCPACTGHAPCHCNSLQVSLALAAKTGL